MNVTYSNNRASLAAAGALTACALAVLLFAEGCAPGYSGGNSIEALGGGGSTEPTVSIKPDASAESDGGDSGGPVAVAGYGSVSGRVVLEGGQPVLTPLLPGGQLRDPSACIRENIPDYRVVVGPNNGLANVFVFLPRKPKGTPEEAETPPETSIEFDQKFCTFKPHALLMRAGQTVRVLNSDPVAHNTHTLPKSNGSFNNAVKENDDVGLPLVYQRGEREPVRVVCDFHAWMLAWHLPLDHPYGAVTGDAGSVTLSDVPAGKHKFAVWHEGRKIGDYSVEVQPDQTTPLDVTIESSSLAQLRPAQPPKSVVLSFGSP